MEERTPLTEPRYAHEYSQRLVEAARRVLIDVGQVLASFRDVVVVVGGWVPELLLAGQPPHSGSIDLDLALNSQKLADGRYAELLELLLQTRRYRLGDQEFQLVTDVDLQDGGPTIQVEVEFLAPQQPRLRGKSRVEGFRVLQFPECAAAFTAPEEVAIEGAMLKGGFTTVRWLVVALPDFLILKAAALDRRDKPKDAYDLCYCLEHWPGGLSQAARDFRTRLECEQTRLTAQQAVTILRLRFETPAHYGPAQYAEFFAPFDDPDENDIARQRAFHLVAGLLEHLEELTREE
ncbi:MAG: nucleotidyl transferase AbiEii/AbiGii toxin family protein [Candidatus Eremiobacterota bacterium]